MRSDLAAQGTSNSSQESQKAANDLAEMAAEIRGLVEQFRIYAQDRAVTTRPEAVPPATMVASAGR